MIVSTVGALTLTPMLCSQLLRQQPEKGKLYRMFFTPIEKGLNALDRGYGRFLNWAVRHRKTVIVGAYADLHRQCDADTGHQDGIFPDAR